MSVELTISQNHAVIHLCLSSETFNDDFLKGLRFIKRLLAEKIIGCGVVYGGDLNQKRGDVQIVGFKDIPQLLEIIEHHQETL